MTAQPNWLNSGSFKRKQLLCCSKKEDLDKYLVQDFNDICFLTNFDVNVEFKSSNLGIVKSIGTGFNIPEEHIDNDKEWRMKNHKDNAQSFKDKAIPPLLQENQTKNYPSAGLLLQLLRYNKKTVCEVNTAFPSGLINQESNAFIEGGMILLKMKKENTGMTTRETLTSTSLLWIDRSMFRLIQFVALNTAQMRTSSQIKTSGTP